MNDDSFDGLFDSISLNAQAELFGTTFSFPTSARISASTFNLVDTAAPDFAPTFPDAALVQSGGAGSSDPIVTIAVNTVVTGSVELLPGDYNQNGIVDAADYTVWHDSLGDVGQDLPADGDRNGVVDRADYNVWKGSLGATLTGTPARVPEPMSILIAVAGIVASLTARLRIAGREPRRNESR
jgi:hypothetical protein